MTERLPPHNIEAEEGLISACLQGFHPDEIFTVLSPSDFYRTNNQLLFSVISSIVDKGLTVDFVTVIDECRARGILEKIGGASMLVSIMGEVPVATNPAQYAKIIKTASRARGLYATACKIADEACLITNDNISDTFDSARLQISELASAVPSRKKINKENIYTSTRMVDSYIQYIKTLKDNRFLTGINEIDKRIRGVSGGEVMTIIARAGSFKTAMLQNMLLNYVNHSAWSAVFFSLEMPVSSVTERYMGITMGYEGREVENTFLDFIQSGNNAEINELRQGFNARMQRIYVVPVKVSLAGAGEYVKLIESEFKTKVGVIGIDYMGLIDGDGKNEYEVVSNVARGAKELAKEINLPTVILCQASRSGGTGEEEITLDMGRGCFDDKTEILTDKGWMFFDNLDKTEKVLTLNPDTGVAEYHSPKEYYKYLYIGNMFQHTNLRSSFCVTPNHNMYFKNDNSKKTQLNQIQNIKYPKVRIPRSFKWIGKEEQFFILPPIIKKGRYDQIVPVKEIPMDSWLKFLGWYFSEGCCYQRLNPGAYFVLINQKKADGKAEIRSVLNELDFHYWEKKKRHGEVDFAICDQQLFEYLKNFGRKASEKTIPQFIGELSSRQIKIFLNSFLLGDGCTHKTTKYYYSSSSKMSNELQILVLKTNQYAAQKIIKCKGTSTWIIDHWATRTSNMHVVAENIKATDITLSMKDLETIKYSGYVYCVNVEPNHTIYVRRNGHCMWSGNSGAIEEGGDFILGLWQNERKDGLGRPTGVFDLICRILKNRKGPKGSRWKLDVNPKDLTFGEDAVEFTSVEQKAKKKRP